MGERDKKDEVDDLKSFRIGNQVIREQDLEFTIPYKGEVFTLRYPTPLELSQIEADIARRLDGLPRSAYNDTHLSTLEATAYANALVVPSKSPSWFKSAWTCFDLELIGELYMGYHTFRSQFREKLRTGGFVSSR